MIGEVVWKIAEGGVKQRDRGCGYCQSGQCESPGRGLLALEKNYPPMVAVCFPTSGLFGLLRAGDHCSPGHLQE